MRQDLVELIQRMAMRESVTSSDNSDSWQAYRDAEMLADETLVVELVAYLDEKPTRDQRSAAYFIIGKIGKNCLGQECASRLIEYSSKETDKYALANLLERLADIPKPESVDVRPLYPLLKDERWLVRRAAIQSLKRCENAEAKDKLLEILTTTPDSIDAIYCHATLNQIGTHKALPALVRSLESRKRDVKASANAAIEAIKARDSRHPITVDDRTTSSRR
jgi:HEAT repeat protein